MKRFFIFAVLFVGLSSVANAQIRVAGSGGVEIGNNVAVSGSVDVSGGISGVLIGDAADGAAAQNGGETAHDKLSGLSAVAYYKGAAADSPDGQGRQLGAVEAQALSKTHYALSAERLEAVYPAGNCGMFTQALMELGACVCTPKNPDCARCPMRGVCAAQAAGRALHFPVKLPKAEKRVEARTVFLLRCGETCAIRRRPETGLLAGLWELPALDGALTPDEVRQALAARGWQTSKLLSLRPAKHIFTHVEWHMTGYYLELAAPPAELTFVTPADLRAAYALPSAFRPFLSVLEGEA